MAKSQSTHEIAENRAPSTAAAVVPDQLAGSPDRVMPAQPASRPRPQGGGQGGRQGGQGQGRGPQGRGQQAGGGQNRGQGAGGPQQLSQMLNRALALHRAGRLREAEPIYRAVLERAPKRVGALINF